MTARKGSVAKSRRAERTQGGPRKAVAKPAAVKPKAVKPKAAKPKAVKPKAVKPKAVKPVAVKPVLVKPAALKPVLVKPLAVKLAPEPLPEEPEPVESEQDVMEQAPESGQNDLAAEAGIDLVGLGGAGEAEESVQDTAAFLKGLVEALIFVSDRPLELKEVARAAKIDRKRAAELIEELRRDYEGRGVRLDEVSGGFAFRSGPTFATYVRNFLSLRPIRLSRAQLETLAIIAYRQPITRPEIDDIRGVDCGPVLKGLLERDLIRIIGKKDEPGRPMLYGTSPSFLETFSLKSLRDLPTLREFTELSDESRVVFESETGEAAPEGPLLAEEEAPADVGASVETESPHALESDEDEDEDEDEDDEDEDDEDEDEDDEDKDEDDEDEDEDEDDEDEDEDDEDEDEEGEGEGEGDEDEDEDEDDDDDDEDEDEDE